MSRAQSYSHSRAHSPTLPSLYLHHSSFSSSSVALPTSQFILQPFFRFSYVTSSSLDSPGEPHMRLIRVFGLNRMGAAAGYFSGMLAQASWAHISQEEHWIQFSSLDSPHKMHLVSTFSSFFLKAFLELFGTNVPDMGVSLAVLYLLFLFFIIFMLWICLARTGCQNLTFSDFLRLLTSLTVIGNWNELP